MDGTLNTNSSLFARIQYFPASIFGMIMGLTGLVISLFAAGHILEGLNLAASTGLVVVTLVFIILLSLYLIKAIKYGKATLQEMRHPIKMNFGPAISIALILLSIAYDKQGLMDVSFYLWSVGATLQLIFSLWVFNHWIFHDFFEIKHSNPAWFIPIVGNILVPIAGVDHAPDFISWFFFSIGIVFWPIIKSILIYRIVFHPPMMERLIPTLFIFIAPPAVGFISYVKLNGGLDNFAYILYFFGLFFTLFLLSTFKHFKDLSFAISWWAYTFPLAAISIASFTMAHQTGESFFNYIAFAIQALLSLLVMFLLYKTAIAFKNKKICDPTH